ncbi:hypothetical protein ACH436_03725 [Isoptericola sp. NPDC019693]|uniref:hypothetical protein n=1 Tax=Isoptericola sp. NPDC019693 TaxID=3364009 RepID=UPI0037895E7F
MTHLRARTTTAIAAAALAAVAAGCSSGDAPGSASCAAPELSWAQQAASPGELVTLQGTAMVVGCDDTGAGDPERPMRITSTQMFVDGEARPAPKVDDEVVATDSGQLQLQVAVPDDAPDGAVLTVEVTESEGAVVRSGELAVAGEGA